MDLINIKCVYAVLLMHFQLARKQRAQSENRASSVNCKFYEVPYLCFVGTHKRTTNGVRCRERGVHTTHCEQLTSVVVNKGVDGKINASYV